MSDRSLPPAPALPAFYSWTGFYAGGQIGYSRDGERMRQFVSAGRLPTGVAFDQGTDRAVAGVHAGFNHQMGALVLGAEADLEAVDGRARFSDANIIMRVERDWQASLRGRVGFALDRFMIYAAGGVSFADFDYAYDDPVSRLGERGSFSRTGWTAGGGVNHAVTDHIVIGLDYRYTDYGRFDHVAQSAFPGLTAEQNPTLHTVRASVAYRF